MCHSENCRCRARREPANNPACSVTPPSAPPATSDFRLVLAGVALLACQQLVEWQAPALARLLTVSPQTLIFTGSIVLVSLALAMFTAAVVIRLNSLLATPATASVGSCSKPAPANNRGCAHDNHGPRGCCQHATSNQVGARQADGRNAHGQHAGCGKTNN